jgi:hypothetical protein
MFTRLRLIQSLLLIVLVTAGSAACGNSSSNLLEKPAYAPAPITPIGQVEWPIAFTWTPVPGNWSYRLTVVDQAERVLYENEIRGLTRIQPAEDLRGSLTVGATFTWHVALLGPDGKEALRSKDVTFTMR